MTGTELWKAKTLAFTHQSSELCYLPLYAPHLEEALALWMVPIMLYGSPAVVRFTLSRARPVEPCALGEGERTLHAPALQGPWRGAEATAGCTATEISLLASVFTAIGYLLESKQDPFPAP